MNTTELIAQSIETVTQMMAIAAITAPKAKGENFVAVEVLQGPVLQQLSQAMIAFGEQESQGELRPGWQERGEIRGGGADRVERA